MPDSRRWNPVPRLIQLSRSPVQSDGEAMLTHQRAARDRLLAIVTDTGLRADMKDDRFRITFIERKPASKKVPHLSGVLPPRSGNLLPLFLIQGFAQEHNHAALRAKQMRPPARVDLSIRKVQRCCRQSFRQPAKGSVESWRHGFFPEFLKCRRQIPALEATYVTVWQWPPAAPSPLVKQRGQTCEHPSS